MATRVKNSMRVIDRTKGDQTIGWDPSDEDETRAAREMFDELRREKRYLAYTLDEHDKRGRQITEFDPTVERMILTPPLSGG